MKLKTIIKDIIKEEVSKQFINEIKFKDIMPNYIYIGKEGWEIPIEDGKFIFPKEITSKDKQDARSYIKGLRILFNRSKEFHSFDSNNNNPRKKLSSLIKSVTKEEIIKIGNGAKFEVTFYVDGTASIDVK